MISILYKCKSSDKISIVTRYIRHIPIDIPPVIAKKELGIKHPKIKCIINTNNPNKIIILWINTGNTLVYK